MKMLRDSSSNPDNYCHYRYHLSLDRIIRTYLVLIITYVISDAFPVPGMPILLEMAVIFAFTIIGIILCMVIYECLKGTYYWLKGY